MASNSSASSAAVIPSDHKGRHSSSKKQDGGGGTGPFKSRHIPSPDPSNHPGTPTGSTLLHMLASGNKKVLELIDGKLRDSMHVVELASLYNAAISYGSMVALRQLLTALDASEGKKKGVDLPTAFRTDLSMGVVEEALARRAGLWSEDGTEVLRIGYEQQGERGWKRHMNSDETFDNRHVCSFSVPPVFEPRKVDSDNKSADVTQRERAETDTNALMRARERSGVSNFGYEQLVRRLQHYCADEFEFVLWSASITNEARPRAVKEPNAKPGSRSTFRGKLTPIAYKLVPLAEQTHDDLHKQLTKLVTMMASVGPALISWKIIGPKSARARVERAFIGGFDATRKGGGRYSQLTEGKEAVREAFYLRKPESFWESAPPKYKIVERPPQPPRLSDEEKKAKKKARSKAKRKAKQAKRKAENPPAAAASSSTAGTSKRRRREKKQREDGDSGSGSGSGSGDDEGGDEETEPRRRRTSAERGRGGGGRGRGRRGRRGRGG